MSAAKWGSVCVLLMVAFCSGQTARSSNRNDSNAASQPSPNAGQSGAQGSETNRGQPPAPSSAAPKSQQENQQEKNIEKQEQSQRVLGVLPQFAVTNRKNAPPLTPGEKFHLFAKSAFDPAELGITAAQAGVSQAENEFPEYGQGMQGFAKRYGASLADEVSSGFFSNFAWSTLLKEDPRYFRSGEGTLKRRFFYALEQEFVCHTDRGGRSFNWQNTLGALSSGGLSNIYYPQSDRGLELTMSRASIAIAYGSLSGLLEEFWPDVSRKLHRHAKTPAAGAPKTP
jgi:hypothetical protein